MKTYPINRQDRHPAQLTRLQKLTDWLGRKLEACTAPDTWSEVSILLVDDEGITQTNREYFGKNRPTDVISFRYEPVPGEAPAYSGDLVVLHPHPDLDWQRRTRGMPYRGTKVERFLKALFPDAPSSGVSRAVPSSRVTKPPTRTKYVPRPAGK